MKQCQTVVSIGSPARLVPSCVCAMDTDSPGLCSQPEFRGWLGGCCPESCPWKTDVSIESLAPSPRAVKLTCGFQPTDCEFMEPVTDKKALPCGYFNAGQCGSFNGTCDGCQYAEPVKSKENDCIWPSKDCATCPYDFCLWRECTPTIEPTDEEIKKHLCPSVEKAVSCDTDCDNCEGVK